MSNISNFMNKIKMNNYTFTYDGKNINDFDHFKKTSGNSHNSQSNYNISTRSNSNSKYDGLSAKRKTNAQSNSGSVNYFA